MLSGTMQKMDDNQKHLSSRIILAQDRFLASQKSCLGNHLSPASGHAVGDKGRQGETKQNHLSPTFRNLMGDKGRQSKITHHGRQRETRGDKAKSSQPSIRRRRGTKQNHPSPTSRHTMGDKGKQRKIISAQHPESRHSTEDKGDQAKQGETKQNHLSPPSRHAIARHAMGNKGRQGKAKSFQPSIQTRHEWAMGNKERQSKIISAQHPDTDKGRREETIILAQHRFYARIENPSQQSWLGNHGRDKGRPRDKIILAQHRFYARIENPSQQSCLVKKLARCSRKH